jgi:hypothetical protein
MEIKDILIEKSNYFSSWNSKKLNEIFLEIDINATKKYRLIIIAKNYIKSMIGEKKVTCLSLDFYLVRGFDIEYAKNEISKIQSNNVSRLNEKKKINPGNYKSSSPVTIEFWMNKGLTLDEAVFKTKSCRPVNKEYWISKGYSEKESEDKIKEFQIDMSNRFQKKLKDNPENYSDIRNNQKLYWEKRGFSEEEAIKKVKERQSTFSLEKCIERYGEIEGGKIFEDRQKKWTKSLFNNFEEYGDGRSLQSKWASEIIDYLCNELKINRPKKEKWISSKNRKLKCSYDFTFDKKIIEFNGDYWHCNPLKYPPEHFHKRLKMKASERWKIDEEKIQLAESQGYKVLIIWESEYHENLNLIINKCLNFLK